jgi:hypothetical protein
MNNGPIFLLDRSVAAEMCRFLLNTFWLVGIYWLLLLLLLLLLRFQYKSRGKGQLCTPMLRLKYSDNTLILDKYFLGDERNWFRSKVVETQFFVNGDDEVTS